MHITQTALYDPFTDDSLMFRLIVEVVHHVCCCPYIYFLVLLIQLLLIKVWLRINLKQTFINN